MIYDFLVCSQNVIYHVIMMSYDMIYDILDAIIIDKPSQNHRGRGGGQIIYEVKQNHMTSYMTFGSAQIMSYDIMMTSYECHMTWGGALDVIHEK